VIGTIVVVLALATPPAQAAPSVATGLRALGGHEQALVSLEHAHARAAGWALSTSGGVRLSADVEIWRVPSAAARRLVPRLAASGMVRWVGPDLRFRPLGNVEQLEPLFATQWWYSLVGADRAQPPGPGKPITVLDTGIDLSHPEFRGRPDTVALDTITFNDEDLGSHGTAVGSLAAAPVNGVGLVGVYPRARLQIWDGYDLSFGAVIAGLAAASRLGPGVINLSLGYPAGSFGGNLLQPIEDAVNAAVRRGSLVVAAAGNGREDGSPQLVPASLPHVLTVAATDAVSDVAYFSNAGLTVDLAAPGDHVPIAAPCRSTQPGTGPAPGPASPRRSSPVRRPGSGPFGRRSMPCSCPRSCAVPPATSARPASTSTRASACSTSLQPSLIRPRWRTRSSPTRTSPSSSATSSSRPRCERFGARSPPG